jgi:hypothetical protein
VGCVLDASFFPAKKQDRLHAKNGGTGLKVAFADVADGAEGLEVLGLGKAAFAGGDDVVDMEDNGGIGGGGGAAVFAAEVVALHDEVAEAPGDGAGMGGVGSWLVLCLCLGLCGWGDGF